MGKVNSSDEVKLDAAAQIAERCRPVLESTFGVIVTCVIEQWEIAITSNCDNWKLSMPCRANSKGSVYSASDWLNNHFSAKSLGRYRYEES